MLGSGLFRRFERRGVVVQLVQQSKGLGERLVDALLVLLQLRWRRRSDERVDVSLSRQRGQGRRDREGPTLATKYRP